MHTSSLAALASLAIWAAGTPSRPHGEWETQSAQDQPAVAREEPVVSRRPNVILFLVDDLGWRDVGFMGNTFIETPSADALSAAGMVFERAYANAPNCTPSRAALLTGTWPTRSGIHTVNIARHGDVRLQRWHAVESNVGLAPGQTTLPGLLRAAGWRTAAIGKWHLGSDPATAGFDVALAGDDRGAPREGHFSPYGIEGFADGPVGEALAERLTDEALSFITASGEQPFFLYLSHYSVHTPIETSRELKRKYEQKAGDGGTKPGYAAMVDALDRSLGRLLAGLAGLGLADDTIVIFTSDNGGHGGLSELSPLRGGKGTLYEAGVRVPLAVRWPARVPGGTTSATPVILSDLAATVLDACGVEPPSAETFDGPSLLPILAGEGTIGERALFWHFPVYLKPDRRGEPFRSVPCGSILRGHTKLIESFEDGSVQLFDLAEDPGETRDLAQQRPAQAAELRERLRAWRAQTGALVPTERNLEYDPTAADG